MTDNTELKRLAEAFPADLDWDSNTEPFFNGPSGESLGGGSTGFYCVYGPDFEIDGEQYDGPTYVETCKADFAKFMVAARDGVLELIAENEKLKVDLREVKDAKLGLSWAIGEIMGERDQLKAENEALRKGSVRYEWLRDKQTFIWLIQDWFPSDAEFTDVDAVIDAAMGKGELS